MLKLTVACIALLGSMGAACAATNDAALEGPKMAFDATYDTTSPGGKATMRMLSDGKGHMKTVNETMGQKMVTIMDYPAKTAWTIIEQTKTIMKVPLKGGTEVHDAESAKKAHAKDLGSKNVNGHPAHGWEYSSESGTVQTWVGDDIHYVVKSDTKTPHGNMTMDLKKWSSAAPSADEFKTPSGYKTMNLPGT